MMSNNKEAENLKRDNSIWEKILYIFGPLWGAVNFFVPKETEINTSITHGRGQITIKDQGGGKKRVRVPTGNRAEVTFGDQGYRVRDNRPMGPRGGDALIEGIAPTTGKLHFNRKDKSSQPLEGTNIEVTHDLLDVG